MNTARSIALVSLLGLSLSACGRDAPPAAQSAPDAEPTVIASVVGKAVSEAVTGAPRSTPDAPRRR